MAEDDKQEQNKGAEEQQSTAAPWSQTGAGSTEDPDQGQQPADDSSNAEQTGEGTGARAGEYS
jgi:hypothetical protein